MATGLVLGVDVGGTKVLAGVVDAGGTVRATAHRSTPERRVAPEMVEDALVEAVLEAAGGAPIAAVGVAAAGFVDAHGTAVQFAPHLPWRGEPLRDNLAERWAVPVLLDNDANCAAVAEWAYGAARRRRLALMITLGTGIGGSLLVDGQVVRGAHGMAGEFGHMQVVPDGLPCQCGGRGCWEQYCSGSALVRYAQELIGVEPTMMEEACGGRPERLTGPMVTAAAEAGDIGARHAFVAVGEWLGVGAANLVAALDPDVIVVGGGVSDAGEKLLEPARAALQRSLVGAAYREVPPIEGARLGPQAGMIGAATLARQLVGAGVRGGPRRRRGLAARAASPARGRRTRRRTTPRARG
jgi:glucokinase